ncbi:MBOAT family protein [Lentimicrobium sp.]
MYYQAGSSLKQWILFIASMVFIGIISPNILLFTLTFVVLNYFLGKWLYSNILTSRRTFIFWLSIGIDIGILAFFKYINFLFDNLNIVLGWAGQNAWLTHMDLLIPLGISYYTFQALGYLIRINRKAEKAEPNFVHFANYMIFFPKFLAGPVERSAHFLPQVNRKISFSQENISAGLRLFLWGMFKKVVLGDNLAGPVQLVFSNVESYSGVPLMLVFVVQTLHLYCDFSGYTDMALGIARVFGIQLIDNFNRPFFAKTVGEFWRRWHISLSSWCNDFIYNPFIIKYRRFGNQAAITGIFLTFFVIGIWHGANWTFVVVGLLQGLAISYEFITRKNRMRLLSRINPAVTATFSRLLVFLFFCLTLVFFNSRDIHDALYFITHMFKDVELKFSGNKLIYNSAAFLLALTGVVVLMLLEYFEEKKISATEFFLKQPRWIRWSGYYLVIAMIFYFSGSGSTFVYLQF